MRDRPESRIEYRVSSIVGRLTLVLIAAFCMTFELFAAPKVRYRYGESWWYEYEADRETSLLLHFGKPQPKRAKELAKQVEGKRTEKAKEKKEDAELTTLEEDLRIEGGQDDPGGEFKVAQPEEMKKR